MNTEPTDQNLCPGRHDPVRRPAPALRPDETLCSGCVSRAAGQLRGISDDLLELETTVARQSAVRHTGTARRRAPDPNEDTDDGVPTAPLPFDTGAARVRDDVVQRLREWAAFLRLRGVVHVTPVDIATAFGVPSQLVLPARDRDSAPPRCVHDMVEGTCAVCAGLPDVAEELLQFVPGPRPPIVLSARRHPRRVEAVHAALAVLRSSNTRNWMRTDEQGPALAEAVDYVRARIRNSIDRFDRRWWAGPCGAKTEVISLVEIGSYASAETKLKPVARTVLCDADLYAEPGKAIVVCDGYRGEPGSGCGAVHPAATRHKHMVRTVRDRWLPLPALLASLPTLIGKAVDPAAVRKWRSRGKLRPLVCLRKHDLEPAGRAGCRVCRGELYSGAQLLDLVAEYEPGRRGPKPRTGPQRSL